MLNNFVLKCQRCSHIWAYKGKNNWVTSCSNCKTTVYFKKNMIPSGLLVDGPRGQTESKVHSHDTSDPKSLQFCSNEELD
jgi:hypothetical protein